LGGLWQHRWLFAVPVATLVLPATVYAVRLPDTYRARAVVYVRPLDATQAGAGLPQERAAQAHEMVQSSRDRLLTAVNAAAIVPVLAPHADPKDPLAVTEAQERVLWDRAGDSAFAVSLEDTNPERAAKAVNTLLASFQEQERAHRLAQAEGLLRSHEAGLQVVQREHQQALAALDGLRAQHEDALPEQETLVTQELAQLRSEILWQEQAAQHARERARLLGEQIARLAAPPTAGRDSRRASAEEEKLSGQLAEQQRAADGVRKRLVEERTHRTEKHPEVQALQRQLAVLEADVRATVASLDAARRASQERDVQAQAAQARASVGELGQLRQVAVGEEAQLQATAAQLREQTKTLQARLVRMADVKPLLQKQERAVESAVERVRIRETAHANQRVLVEHLRSADPNEVTGYRVDEPALAPARPTGPSRMRYLAAAVGLGLLIGYGLLALRRRYADQPVDAPFDLGDLLPGTLVVTVPLLGASGLPRRRFAWGDLVLGLWVLAALGGTVLVVAARKGMLEGPAWLLALVGKGA
jgi:uncharacterized protein involved in exopolysaccharide biosynthesis